MGTDDYFKPVIGQRQAHPLAREYLWGGAALVAIGVGAPFLGFGWLAGILPAAAGIGAIVRGLRPAVRTPTGGGGDA